MSSVRHPLSRNVFSFTHMKAAEFLVLVEALAILFFAGCASPKTPAEARDEFHVILDYYNTQKYQECLAEIDKVLSGKTNKGQRGTLLLIKGSCEEEMGKEEAARATYTLVQKEFSQTKLGDDAQRRLERRNGDQREHLELNANALGWHRGLKQCNAESVRQFFYPAGEGLKRYKSKLTVVSTDRNERSSSLEQVWARAEAEFGLSGGKAYRRLLDRKGNEEYWEIEQSSSGGKRKTVLLCRLILTQDRFHFAQFMFSKARLTEVEKSNYLACLRSGQLVESK